jgi:hypothetical protein
MFESRRPSIQQPFQQKTHISQSVRVALAGEGEQIQRK